ncbi:MAG TPA: hypothetical protein VNA04_01005, partial [Thermoanaerobaculia bacterium]|nr:hypothetical protein [Thermoanaerobaculia bacterium]
RAVQWSPDGRSLAGHQVGSAGVEQPGLYIHSLEDGSFKQVAKSVGGHDFVWLPDGRRMVIRDVSGNIQMLDTATGVTKELVHIGHELIGFGGLSVSADGKSVYFVRDSAEADIWLLQLDDPPESLTR